MDQWIELRRQIREQEVSLRQLERDTGIHRQTLRKIRDNSQPPGYQRSKPVEKSKIGPYMAVGLTHSRGVDGVMPIESLSSLEGVNRIC